MVVNATFNNISVILWRSVLLVEEIRVPGENAKPLAGEDAKHSDQKGYGCLAPLSTIIQWYLAANIFWSNQS